jgi:hypothetical protein
MPSSAHRGALLLAFAIGFAACDRYLTAGGHGLSCGTRGLRRGLVGVFPE